MSLVQDSRQGMTACPHLQGDNCLFAHGVYECWLHPAKYRTQMCKDTPGCTREVCFFAHSPTQLRRPHLSTAKAEVSVSIHGSWLFA